MITACSSRTSCIISADAGTTCSVAGCDAVAWLSWYWAMMTPPSTLTKVAGRTSTTSLPTNRLSKGASCFGAKFFGAKFVCARYVLHKSGRLGRLVLHDPRPFDHPVFQTAG